jgi:hypothetical protein
VGVPIDRARVVELKRALGGEERIDGTEAKMRGWASRLPPITRV